MEELTLKQKESLVILTEKLSIEEFTKKTNLKHFEAMQIIKSLIQSHYIYKVEGYPTKYCVERFLFKKVKQLQKRLDMTSLQSNGCEIPTPTLSKQ